MAHIALLKNLTSPSPGTTPISEKAFIQRRFWNKLLNGRRDSSGAKETVLYHILT
jgi:hypothetical protein